ncbi:MAG TPA: DNA helicase RecQ [Chitinispirillaceae bacterium]|nr:DNA helicase RecQ [Chitinispirillaceae bacterium]
MKRIICLANARKKDAFCIAGVDPSTGVWVRPVSTLDDGRVEQSQMSAAGALPRPGDLLEIPLSETGPDFGYEQENRSILDGEWRSVGTVPSQALFAYRSSDKYILHNSEPYVTREYLEGLPDGMRSTLQLVEAFEFEAFHSVQNGAGVLKWNAGFVNPSGERLTSRIVDPFLIEKLEKGYRPARHCLVTVMLSEPFRPKNWQGNETPCWKLIAGVIELEQGKWSERGTTAPAAVERSGRDDDTSAITDKRILTVLKEVFGFTGFRPNQQNVIRAILNNKDCLAIMPTGGGKSLCYQLPAHLLEGTCVVISPLISLMKDQVDSATDTGLSAASITSAMSERERSDVWRRLVSGQLELVYVSPERFSMDSFITALKQIKVCLFAIDEAHCISEWGHDFRPDYLNLSSITRHFPDVPIAAFTATATHRVAQDIADRLRLRAPEVVRASFDRPNLFYEVVPKGNVESQIIKFINEHKGEPGIVYRMSRRGVDETVEELCDAGIKALPYHAGMDDAARHRNQDAFNRDEVDVIVATIAFGMGIDKPNVRYVIHGDLPKNMESYYQETGRAGRDGEPSRCVMYFSYGDIPRIKYFIDQVLEQNERRRLNASLNEMVAYASAASSCRRKRILSYFGETYTKKSCDTCDICVSEAQMVDVTSDALLLLNAIASTGQRFGTGHIIDVIRGSEKARILELRHNELDVYGKGKHLDLQRTRTLFDHLFANDLIARTDDEYSVIKLTPQAKAVMAGESKVLVRAWNEKEQTSGKQNTMYAEEDVELFTKLKNLRRRLADEKGVPPFVIFADRSLHEMAIRRPTTRMKMFDVHGVGEVKMETYGELFLVEIREHLGVQVQPDTDDQWQREKRPPRKSKIEKSDTVNETWNFVKQGCSVAEIAQKRALAEGTIAEHIEKCILEGRDVPVDKLVPEEIKAHLLEIIPIMQSDRLKEIKDAAREEVTYAQIKIVRAWWMREVAERTEETAGLPEGDDK